MHKAHRLLAPPLLLAASCMRAEPPEHTPLSARAPEAVVQRPKRCALPDGPPATLRASALPDGFPSQSCVSRARSLVAQMTLAEKAGQMMQPDRGMLRPGDLQSGAFGSLLSGGGSAPADNTPHGWARMATDFREQSLATRLAIPLLYGVDAVHGHNNVPGAVIFPHNIGLGASRDPELVTRVGRATAIELAATGMDWTFAPVVASARDERWGRTYEAFGETPELAELLGPALIRGLQGRRLGERPDSVLACAKHFLGDGHTEHGRDQGDSPLRTELIERDVLPAYSKAIEAGVGSIMASFSSVGGVKMHCHGPLLNDTLKARLGFNGFLVSDWRAIEQLPGDYEAQLVSAINAGIDMIMAPAVYTGFLTTLQRLVPARIPVERIDDAVARILAVKCALGRLEPNAFRREANGRLALPGSVDRVGAREHRLLGREAVRKSLVLLQNERRLLPLSKQAPRIHVAGSHADDIGNQCGGWTISWQGRAGAVTNGTTLRQAIEAAVAPGSSVTYSLDGSGAAGAQVAVVAVGEPPYAEGRGDDARLHLDPKQVEVVRRVKAAGVPVVVVLMTGRPVLLGELSHLSDALVAAWLPGTEGQGITDVLFGDHDFSGKLPHSWPRSIEQLPINVGDASYDPLFPYGHGLTLHAPHG